MYDVIVVGGGHAGIEASLAPSRMGLKTLLVTSNINNIGSMPCNTSIGGPAKGIIVREIDALGGQMSKTADKTYLQMKMLNTAKGPGVQSLRAQADKKAYPRYMQKVVKEQENLDLIEGMVEDLVVEDQTVKGVILDDGTTYLSKTAVLTPCSYLKAEILVGHSKHASGPDQQKESKFLSGKLKDYGFRIQRLKTGTPPRVEINSIDYSKTSLQPGTDAKLAFSFTTDEYVPIEKQTPCYLTYTNETTHKIIHDNLEKCAMYSGLVKGIGPRYCPSIEDKVVKFADKNRHQVFLEPEGRYTNEMYVGGMSSSLPEDVQIAMYHTVPGLEHAKIVRNAYAIEYDCINPRQLLPSLEFKAIKNLFSGGQFNGSSGYEEAAAQGLIAGINAALRVQGKEELVLDRSESYIGVLIDDLVTKENHEPYRMMTSRAEYRLLLRQDNADLRLRKYGYRVGLISEEQYEALKVKEQRIQEEIERVENTYVGTSSNINELLEEYGSALLSGGSSLAELIRRPELNYKMLAEVDPKRPKLPEDVQEQVNINIKYDGYIKRQMKQVEQFKKMEENMFPEYVNYDEIQSLRIEAKQKLNLYRPINIGQASRISGVSPADISVLLVYLGHK